MNKSKIIGYSVALALLSGLPAVANAAKPDKQEAKRPPAMIVVIDQETGQMRPATAAEQAALSQRFRTGTSDLLEQRNKSIPRGVKISASGVKSATLDLSRMQFLVAEQNEKGELMTGHLPMDAESLELPQTEEGRARQ